MSNPKRPAVSIKGETYKRLKEEAGRRGISIVALLDLILSETTLIKGGNDAKVF